MNRKEIIELERTLSNLASEKISKVVTVKLQYSLWRFLKQRYGNISDFVRKTIIERLERELESDE